jgi:hypothetical protein
MASIVVRFVRPSSLIGRLITWRLKEPYSHVVFIIDGLAYSSTFPFVSIFPLTHKSVAMPPREGVDLTMQLTDQEAAVIRNWCDSQIGKLYDFVSIIGWILGVSSIQSVNRTYCFEFCRQPLVLLGLLKPTRKLIKGDRLYQEIAQIIASRAMVD